jgi:serine/threonine protein kinase
MHDRVQEKTYRTLLLERQGRRFSESEVTEILRQVLPQLAQIHHQGQVHGAISLDSLVQRDGRAVLINIAPSLSGQLSISEDIYALGTTIIELLTGKAPYEMREPNSKWNWEEYCVLSDQLVEVINRMVANFPQNRFASANEALSAFSFTVPSPMVAPPMSSFDQSAPTPSDIQPVIFYHKKVKITPWQWGLIGGGLTLALALVGFRLLNISNPHASLIIKNTLTNHTNNVNSIAISRDGQTLVSGSADNTIKIWDLKTGELKHSLTGHTSYIGSLAISPDGQSLASGSADNTIKIWNLKIGKLENTLAGHSNIVNSIAISPDGQTLVSGSWDDTIKIWN